MKATPHIALILVAAGHGTRFGGPKQLVAVHSSGACIAEFSVLDAAKAGIDLAVLVIRPEHEALWRGKNWPIPVHLAVQHEARGTGDALAVGMRCAAEQGAEVFVVGNADDYYGDLWQGAVARARMGRNASLAYPLSRVCSPHGPVNRAVLFTNAEGQLVELQEHSGLTPADVLRLGDPPVSMNAWVLARSVLDWWPPTPRDGGEFGIPDAVRFGLDRGDVFWADTLGTTWMGLTYAADHDAVLAYFNQHF
jgi:hypothetical protein